MDTELLTTIYQAVYGDLDAPGRLASLDELAASLSRIAGKSPAWSGRYLNSVILGHKGFRITNEMGMALQSYASRLDGMHPLQALLVEITCYSVGERVKPNSIITGESKRCACTVLFVPHHPRQKYCSKECPARVKGKKK